MQEAGIDLAWPMKVLLVGNPIHTVGEVASAHQGNQCQQDAQNLSSLHMN